jgi:hypothetical protein
MLCHYLILIGPIAVPPFLGESVLKIDCVATVAAFLAVLHAQSGDGFDPLVPDTLQWGDPC